TLTVAQGGWRERMLRNRWVALMLGMGISVGTALAQDAPSSSTSSPPPVTQASDAPAAANVAPAVVATPDETGDFNRELLTVEEEVDAIKERVFRAKSTLVLLKEIVIEGASTGARATIWHINKLGSGYKLESITYLLDGQ